MVGMGVLMVAIIVSILRSQNELLRGAIIPLSLLLLILVGYGSYILYSRPAHARSSIALYQQDRATATEQEKSKHINDNKAGKTLMRYVYPGLMLLSVLTLLVMSSPYYRGMALGFVLLFVCTYVIDYGFVSRSDDFISFLNTLQ